MAADDAAASRAVVTAIVRIDHLCCGAEAKLIRELLDPLDDVLDVKISVNERRAAIDHRSSLPAAEIVRVLNTKQLGASIAEAGGAAATTGAAMTKAEILRSLMTTGQILLFCLALGLKHLTQLDTAATVLSLGRCCSAGPCSMKRGSPSSAARPT